MSDNAQRLSPAPRRTARVDSKGRVVSDALGAGVGDPDDWERKRPPTVMSFAVRQRVREALEQTHGIVVERLHHATRTHDVATRSGLVAEIRGLAAAEREGQPVDARNALLAIAATSVLLAELTDRPEDLPRGEKRAGTKRYRPPSYAIPEAA